VAEDGVNTETSTTPTLEELTRRLEKLTAENNNLRRKLKGKKTKGGSSSSKDEDFSLEEDISKKGKKGRNNRDKPSHNSVSFNYDNMPSTTLTLPYPLVKLPILMELVIINGSIA
jgi:predicted RNase H-like nuclease (RuvC/YqgF family)